MAPLFSIAATTTATTTSMSGHGGGAPPGLRAQQWSLRGHRYAVLLITFVAYACYHASRKPTGIVKSVLSKGWSPFNGAHGTSKLGEIDVAFLACYAIGMYVAGHLGDRMDLRLFLATGMLGSGIFVGLFGMGSFWNVHGFWYYLLMQMMAGFFEATGWPSVVAVIGNWFGKHKRGLIMGVWNAHTSVGNICGSLLAAAVLDYGWGWSFLAPAALVILGGLFVYFFLAPYPEDVGFSFVRSADADADAEEPQLSDEEAQQNTGFPREASVSIGLLQACMIPGVIPFALCLFFAKLVAYTFLYWLPFYLTQTEIGGKYISVKSAGNLSTLFDVGGIFGGIIAGYISDKLNARALTAATFMYAAIPSMLLYRYYGSVSMNVNIGLMMVTGLLVNGPYALITTAVSADLGTHNSLRGDSRALATVTSIIDGTGSVGAALGPLLTGFISTRGWNGVFIMLVLGAFIAGLLLTRLIIAEIAEKRSRHLSSERQNPEATVVQPLLEPLLEEETLAATVPEPLLEEERLTTTVSQPLPEEEEERLAAAERRLAAIEQRLAAAQHRLAATVFQHLPEEERLETTVSQPHVKEER